MSELRTAALTVLGGVTVLVLGEALKSFLIEPVLGQRRLIGNIAYSLVFYANLYANPGVGKAQAMDEASEQLRQHASELRATVYTIPWYGVLQVLHLVPRRQACIEASRQLVGLSNAVHQGNGEFSLEMRTRIEQLLKLTPMDAA